MAGNARLLRLYEGGRGRDQRAVTHHVHQNVITADQREKTSLVYGVLQRIYVLFICMKKVLNSSVPRFTHRWN